MQLIFSPPSDVPFSIAINHRHNLFQVPGVLNFPENVFICQRSIGWLELVTMTERQP